MSLSDRAKGSKFCVFLSHTVAVAWSPRLDIGFGYVVIIFTACFEDNYNLCCLFFYISNLFSSGKFVFSHQFL